MINAGADFTIGRADLLATVGAGLDIPTQDRLLGQIIDSAELSRRNSEIRITFTDGFADALKPVIAGVTANDR